MTWEPPTRPSWMAAVNNALVDPVTVEARRPITSFALAGAVAFRLGLRTDEVRAAVGEATLEALDVLTEAIEREADLTLTGRWLAHRLLSRLLTAQVHIARLPTAEPTGAASVQRPVFVLRWGGRPPPPGHDHRSEPTRLLQPWEAVWPVPPGEAADDERADRWRDEERLVHSAIGPAVHHGDHLASESVDADEEAVSLLGSFRAGHFGDRFHVPSYDRWLATADLAPVGQWLRQVLHARQRPSQGRWQATNSATRWRIDGLIPLYPLDAIAAEFPDADLVVVHHDPADDLLRQAVRTAELRWAHSQYVDPALISSRLANRSGTAADHLVELAANPQARWAGTAASRPDPYPARDAPAYRALANDFGLDLADVDLRFQAYRERFDVPRTTP